MDQELKALFNQLQRLDVVLPEHQQSLRKRLLTLHAVRDGNSHAPLRAAYRMSTLTNLRKTLPVGVVIILGVLILGWMLLSPGSAEPSDKRRFAEHSAAPEQQVSSASVAIKDGQAQSAPNPGTDNDTGVVATNTSNNANVVVAQATAPAAPSGSPQPQTEGDQTVLAPNAQNPAPPAPPPIEETSTAPQGLTRAMEVHIQNGKPIPLGLGVALQVHGQIQQAIQQ